MWARLNKRGTHLYCSLAPRARRRLATVLLAKDERRKKQIVVEQRRRNRLRCGVGGRPHRCATPSSPRPPSTSLSSFSAAWLWLWPQVLVGWSAEWMNAAGANQGPSQDTPHSLNAFCCCCFSEAAGGAARAPVCLWLLQEKEEGAPPTTPRFPSYVPFYSGLGWSSDRKSSSLLRLDYWNHDFLSL